MPAPVLGNASGDPVGVVVVTSVGPKFWPKIEMISSGQTAEVTPAAVSGLGLVPVCVAAGVKLAALTTAEILGMFGSVTLKVVETGGWSGLVTDRVQSQVAGHTGRPAVRVKYSFG